MCDLKVEGSEFVLHLGERFTNLELLVLRENAIIQVLDRDSDKARIIKLQMTRWRQMNVGFRQERTNFIQVEVVLQSRPLFNTREEVILMHQK